MNDAISHSMPRRAIVNQESQPLFLIRRRIFRLHALALRPSLMATRPPHRVSEVLITSNARVKRQGCLSFSNNRQIKLRLIKD